MLKEGYTKNGYAMVRLSKNNKAKSFTVHKLVANAYLDKPEYATEVNHKDKDRRNNKLYNLEWVTHRANVKHKIESDGKLVGTYQIKGKYGIKWCARIRIGNKRHYLGVYDTELEAHFAYIKKYNEIEKY